SRVTYSSVCRDQEGCRFIGRLPTPAGIPSNIHPWRQDPAGTRGSTPAFPVWQYTDLGGYS
ncbi:hypothetical protein J6590_107529, partial [Homalodisca vitripennis]